MPDTSIKYSIKGKSDMNCPYCYDQMVKGSIEGSGRTALRWIELREKRGVFDKMADALDEKNIIAKVNIISKSITECYKCKSCNKISINL